MYYVDYASGVVDLSKVIWSGTMLILLVGWLPGARGSIEPWSLEHIFYLSSPSEHMRDDIYSLCV